MKTFKIFRKTPTASGIAPTASGIAPTASGIAKLQN